MNLPNNKFTVSSPKQKIESKTHSSAYQYFATPNSRNGCENNIEGDGQMNINDIDIIISDINSPRYQTGRNTGMNFQVQHPSSGSRVNSNDQIGFQPNFHQE